MDNTISILLVEDEMLVRLGIKGMIPWCDFGFEIVAEASDAEEALIQYEAVQPDVVFTDIKMPGMNGLELAARLKQLNPELPICVLTSHTDFHLVQQGIRIGIFDYIDKFTLSANEFGGTLGRLKAAVLQRRRSVVPSVSSDTSGQGYSSEVKRILEYMEQHYAHKITLEQLAGVVHLNSNYIIRLFKDQLNVPPIAYLIELRIKKAQELLLETDMNINQIAVEVGFINLSHFSRVFKQVTGKSPKRHREQRQHM